MVVRMDVRYDPHASRRMRERSVSNAEVKQTLTLPEVELPGRHGRRNRYRVIGSRRIRVTFHSKSADTYYVWTVTADEVTR
jgi:hypothetical protein